MSPYYPVIEYKSIRAVVRSFDSEGRPYQIHDDYLGDILAKSDFAKGKRRRGRA